VQNVDWAETPAREGSAKARVCKDNSLQQQKHGGVRFLGSRTLQGVEPARAGVYYCRSMHG